VDVKLITIEKRCNSTNVPEKIAKLHRKIMPPEAPTEGEYTKLSNRFGQKPLMIL
jgi:hypothetical protein